MIRMKPGEVQTYLPPPPHKIVEYLNGHIIGHYVMKKALSVAIYNHFCNINFSRQDDNAFTINAEEALVDDAKHYFDRENPSVSKVRLEEKVNIKFDPNDGYMSPVVARVIIEAASHKVRLRGPNALTFDSTGSSKPVNAISSTIAQLFEIPFVKVDCSQLGNMLVVKEPPQVQGSPLRNKCLRTNMRKAVKKNASGSPDQEKDENQNVQQRKNVSPTEENAKNENAENEEKEKTIRKLLEEEDIDEDDEDSLIREEEEEEERRIKARLAKANRRGSLTYLMEGYTDNHETINSVIAKLYKKADFVLSKAQRGIIFLDGMDKIGLNTSCSDLAKKQTLREILQVLDGTNVDVTRAGSEDSEFIDTSQLFFVCFGNFEERGFPSASYSKPEVNLLFPPKITVSPPRSGSSSDDSGNGSGETRPSVQPPRRLSSVSVDCSEGYSSDEDESFHGLRESKLAQQLMHESKTSPIAHYQSLWGMKDVQLKFTPEALEVIANQACSQGAGHEGIGTILEKLFLNIKFDILGSDIVAVEINEDAVYGKERPVYFKRHNYNKKRATAFKQRGSLYSMDEEIFEMPPKLTAPSVRQSRRIHRMPSRLSDYDLAIVEQLEV